MIFAIDFHCCRSILVIYQKSYYFAVFKVSGLCWKFCQGSFRDCCSSEKSNICRLNSPSPCQEQHVVLISLEWSSTNYFLHHFLQQQKTDKSNFGAFSMCGTNNQCFNYKNIIIDWVWKQFRYGFSSVLPFQTSTLRSQIATDTNQNMYQVSWVIIGILHKNSFFGKFHHLQPGEISFYACKCLTFIYHMAA